MTILIVTPNLVPHDAVSNDVLQLRNLLIGAGRKVEIYAQDCHESIQSLIVSRHALSILASDPKNILIYHHSIFWHQGEDIVLKARCQIVFKYHNITPSSFFSYDAHRKSITAMGREQTTRFTQLSKIKAFVGDSPYNAQELIQSGALANKTSVIAPFHCIHDFDDVPTNEELQKTLRDGCNHILFVGRVAPNKGHRSLIQTLNRYVSLFGSNVHLHVIGGISGGDGPYLAEIENLINANNLGSLVTFYDKLSFKDLHTFYSSCSTFLLQSEHEGFCVPILEAQYHNLPVIAWKQCAVGDTVGPGQLAFDELDFDVFAVALNRAWIDQELRKSLQVSGKANFVQYEASALFRQTMEIIGE